MICNRSNNFEYMCELNRDREKKEILPDVVAVWYGMTFLKASKYYMRTKNIK